MFDVWIAKGGSLPIAQSFFFACLLGKWAIEQGRRGTRGSRHCSGVYAMNAHGEALPPLFIFDSGAEKEENFSVQKAWVECLPNV